MIQTLRFKLDSCRPWILCLTLLQAFVMTGGVEAVEARQLGQLKARSESQRLARTFGVPLDVWEVAEPTWLEQSTDAAVAEMDAILDHSRRAVARLVDQATTPEVLPVGELPSREAGQVAGEAPASSLAPRTLPRRSALSAGEGERSVAPRPRAAKELVGLTQTTDVLPLHTVARKARTVDATSLPVAKRTGSAIAPASPQRRSALGRSASKADKAIAPEIVALAASLDHSPAKIFRYVHDQVSYDPKWGIDSTPLGTLWEARGTSWDQAWLLQELLLAAGIDARLEWGEVEIPASLLTNLTGVDDPIRAGDFLTTAGLQVVLLIEGSQVTSARFSHVWVKAFLDYIPNRGVTAGTPDTWIRMDPSITTHQRTDGLRLDQDVAFVLGDHLNSGTELSPRQDYEAALLAHVADQGLPVGTFDDAKSLHRQVVEDFPFVPGTLRAKILSATGESETLPADFENDVEVQLREAGGGPLLTWTTTASAIYGQRLEVVWVGGTSADQAALDLYGGVFAAPPYEVNLRPTLRLSDVEVASGSAIGSAEDVEIQLTLTPPDASGAGDGTATVAGWDLFAGEHGVLSLDYGRAPPELADRFAQGAVASTDSFETEGWQLAQAASTYLQALGDDLQHLVDLSWHRLLTFNTAVFAVQRGAVSTSPDGTPQTFSKGPLALDVGTMPLAVLPVDGVQVSTVPTLELLGSQGSFREGEALASVFGGEHMTAVTFLTRAVREGQILTRVDATHVDAALAAAEISSDAKGSIRAAIDRGLEAWISEMQIESNTFQTTGYILIDPATGSGGYFVTFERRFTPLDGAITFHNPIDLDIITAPTDVIATIDAEGLENWTLSTRPVGEGATTVIATGTGPVDNAVLGEFDPTLLLNGMHDLVLSGQDAAGQPITGKITVSVEGQMKIGNFSLAFVDLELPISGLDIQVVRTYDSRARQLEGDFGYGWRLDIRQGTYRNNRRPGEGWQIVSGFLPCENVQETKSHLTTVRLSDFEVYRFQLRLVDSAPSLGGCFARAEFAFLDGPLPGATLEILGNDEVFYGNASNEVIDVDLLQTFEPDDVRLTTRDGRTFHLDLQDGVTYLEDLNGNTLDIDLHGITHSSGQGIEFVRDTEGRIERIIDPEGEDYLYLYDAAGDLISFTDPLDQTTEFIYGEGHYLNEIIDPLGVRAVRSDYDADGRLVSVTDALGKSLLLDHDIAGRREIATNRLGLARILEYDDRGNTTRTIDELGLVTSQTYDAEDRPLVTTDALGNTTSHTYDSDGDLTSVTDALGNVFAMVYDPKGNLLSVTDPRGKTMNMAYDGRGNLRRIENALSAVTTFTYDSAGNLLTETDASGATTTYEYNGLGHLVRTLGPLGTETTASYDVSGQVTSLATQRTLADGASESLVTDFVVDALDRVTSIRFPNGSTQTVAYEPLGSLRQLTDTLGRQKTVAYDVAGRSVRTDLPDGTTLERGFDAEGRLTSMTDRAGRVRLFEYDAVGRLIKTTFPDGTFTSTIYDDAGRPIASTDELGRTTTYGYDAVGRQIQITDPLGNVSQTAYDASGNVIRLENALGQVTELVYDDVGQLLTTRFPGGSEVHTEYDLRGFPVASIDEAGVRTESAYDALGRLTQVTDALGQITTYAYDELGQRISQTDANGRITRFEYDRMGLMTRRTLPDGSVESMVYDDASRLVARTDFSGQTHQFAYDLDDRVTTMTRSDGSLVERSYTLTGQVAAVADARGTTSYSYDVRDRLLSYVTPEGVAMSHQWDVAGNLTASHLDLGAQGLRTTSFGYDLANRLNRVTDSQGGVYALNLDALGRRSSVAYPNGATTTYNYSPRGFLQGLATQASDGSTLQSFDYDLAVTGHRQGVTEHDGTERTWQLDTLYRLLGEQVVDGQGRVVHDHQFVYDAVGNRTQQTRVDAQGVQEVIDYAFDARDRLLSESSGGTTTATFSWDANGNLTGENRGSETTAYTWDSWNRLVQLTTADDTVVHNTYDADGLRVASTSTPAGDSAVTRLYAHDVLQPNAQTVAELDDGGNVLSEFVRGGDLLSVLRASEARYAHTDGVGSTRALSDETAAVTDRYVYEAYGALAEHVGSDDNPFLFAGEAREPSSGLYDLRARWMQPSIGMLLGMDPFAGSIGRPGTLHRYAYALNNPVHWVDPSGRVASLADMQATLATMITATVKVLNVAFTAIRIADAIQDAYALASTLIKAWRYMSTYSTPEGALLALLNDLKATAGIAEIPDPAQVLSDVNQFLGSNWKDLKKRILRNADDIAGKAAQELFRELGPMMKARAQRAGNFIFYAPSPPGPRGREDQDFPIGKQGSFEVMLPMTGGGRLFGFGYRDKRTKAGHDSSRQFFRIDYAEVWDYDTHCHFGSKKKNKDPTVSIRTRQTLEHEVDRVNPMLFILVFFILVFLILVFFIHVFFRHTVLGRPSMQLDVLRQAIGWRHIQQEERPWQ